MKISPDKAEHIQVSGLSQNIPHAGDWMEHNNHRQWLAEPESYWVCKRRRGSETDRRSFRTFDEALAYMGLEID